MGILENILAAYIIGVSALALFTLAYMIYNQGE
jgi:hypothetical protein